MNVLEQRIKTALTRKDGGIPDRILFDLVGNMSSVRTFKEALENLIASGEVVVLETRGNQRLIDLPPTSNVAQI